MARKSVREWLAASAAILILLSFPALYNGFPLVFFDTGGYLARPFLHDLEPGRSAIYGVFLAALNLHADFWPVVLVQALLVGWLIRLTLRGLRLPCGPVALVAVVAPLALLTSLSWFTAQLMPDILAPAAVLALFLLGLAPVRPAAAERAALVAVVAFAMACHMAILALACGLAGAMVLLWRLAPVRVRPALPLLAVALGILAVPLGNFAVAGRFGFTPGGQTFVFGRLVQDGIVARFLDDACPDPAYRLCDYRAELPRTANDWIWADGSPFRKLGGWDGAADEMARITRASLRAYPLMHLGTALASTLEQFVTLETGDGIVSELWHSRAMIGMFTPDALPRFDAARQQTAGLEFERFNAVQVPVAWACLAGLGYCLLLALRRGDRSLALLHGFVLLALLGNAAICGALSNPHARYQSRMVWLAGLALIAQTLTSREAATEGRKASLQLKL